MRRPEVYFPLIAWLVLSGCVASSSQQPPTTWTTGFWFWQGSSTEAAYAGQTLDVLFVHVGNIHNESPPRYFWRSEQWVAYGELPHELPPAREYWLVFRYGRQGVPDLQVAPSLGREVSRLRADARQRRLNVVGVQLDIDSPTDALTRYAGFLRELKKELPEGTGISITALLDWFRSGTAIAEVIQQVDEFVPQFYDVGDSKDYGGGTSIAKRIDAARWGPVFDRFRKRFRVGISTFGRARMAPRAAPPGTRYAGIAFFNDLVPIDVATNAAFELETVRNQANELVLSYTATQKTHIGYKDFIRGDTLQFILATPEAIRAAVESSRKMGRHVAGVVFFRWPADNERLAMQPGEALKAAGFHAPDLQAQSRIHVIDGRCAVVECVDVYLEGAEPFSPKPVRYHIRSSAELEYFLPEKNIPVEMAGPSQLELSLPPYCGRGRLYLGRAVTRNRSKFTVDEEQ